MSKQTVNLIKLGGSIITHKDVAMSLRQEVLTNLIAQIARARAEKPDELFIIGHGQGSFAHRPAAEYGTMAGFVDERSRLGMAVVQDSAAQLNRQVVAECIRQKIPAVTLAPSNILITKNREPAKVFFELVETYLAQGLCPVTGGDVLVDLAQGCTIWSTEEVLSLFAKEFQLRGYGVTKIIHVTEVPGVFDATGEVIPRITPLNWSSCQSAIGAPKGLDVTGGMLLKVQQSVDLLDQGIESYVLSGLAEDNVYKALMGADWVGTRVCAA